MTVGGSSNSAAQGCIQCAPGTFDPSGLSKYEGVKSSCISCSRGFYQMNAASTLCLPCIPGLFNDQAGQVNCKSCLSNYISEDSNSSECTSCPNGWSSESAASRCNKVPPGSHLVNDVIEECRANHYCPGEAAPEKTCPIGWTSGESSTKWYVDFIYYNTITLVYSFYLFIIFKFYLRYT